MKATLLLSTLAMGLIGVTPSFAQSVSSYSRNFGYPLRRRSVPGPGVRLVRLWGSTRPHDQPFAIPAWAASRITSDRRAP
jgi:hypothetical protein